METRSMISFDWAMKRLLRNKANFEVLEGFLSELLRRSIVIRNIGESESNRDEEDGKFNKVDILVEADGRELVIIELQYDSEADYFQRMLYGVSRSVAEHIHTGDPYTEVRKVYSVNIVYFDLGKGDDYIYHGVTSFTGLHTHSELQLTAAQRNLYGKTIPGELYPEYYIIKVRRFNDVAKDTLDEWIYYLKNNKIGEDFKAQGIDRARQVLSFDRLTDTEKRQYMRRVEEKRIRESEIRTALDEGEEKGLKKGEKIGFRKGEETGFTKGEEIGFTKGEETGFRKGTAEIIRKLSASGMSNRQIAEYTGIPENEVERMLSEQAL